MSKLKRITRRMWWDIKDIALVGTNITRKNGLFMSTANRITVGSVFDLKKNIFGNIVDDNLIYSKKTLDNYFPNYPKILEDSAQPAKKFKIQNSNEIGIEVLASLAETTGVAKINSEISSLIKSSKQIVVDINKWGIDYINEGDISHFLSDLANKGDVRMRQVLDEDNYIATRGIWIKGITYTSEMDKEVITKIKAIIKNNKAELADANIKLNLKSQLQLETNFDYNEKFYPFLKFRKIKHEKKEDYYLLADSDLPNSDIFLDDVNFTEYTV